VIEHGELVEGTLLNLTRKAARPALIPYFLSFSIGKTFDHIPTIELFPFCVNIIIYVSRKPLEALLMMQVG
jgi:hypothetical protein